MSTWPEWLRALAPPVGFALLGALLFALVIHGTETGQQWKALKRREADPELWHAQRMSIVAEKAPHLHAEILRARERSNDAPLP